MFLNTLENLNLTLINILQLFIVQSFSLYGQVLLSLYSMGFFNGTPSIQFNNFPKEGHIAPKQVVKYLFDPKEYTTSL